MLVGKRGNAFARRLRYRLFFSGIIARTAVLDEFILQTVSRDGAVCVVNLGAGLDARPYRLALPADLRWIEADLPGILDYKAKILIDTHPACRLERHGVDLSDAAGRRELFDVVPADQPTIVVTEGVVPYLDEGDVAELATDLAGRAGYRWWAVDLLGASLAHLANRLGRRQLSAADAMYKFAPREGPEFFRPFGWEPIDIRTSWLKQRRLGCEPWPLRATWAVSPKRLRDAIGKTGLCVLLKRR
jgi:methyltransferase (TIGR00027 family)